MQESRQLQLGNPKAVDVEVRVCDTCGDVGLEKDLILCHKCPDGAEHTYCMRIKVVGVRSDDWDWTCEECKPRQGTNELVPFEDEEVSIGKYERSTRREPGKGSKSKHRLSYARRSKNHGASSSARLQLKRPPPQVPLEAQPLKKSRAIVASSSKRSNDSLLLKDLSSSKVKKTKKKMKSLDELTCSDSEMPSDSHETAKVPDAVDDIEPVTPLYESNDKPRALKISAMPPKAPNASNHSLPRREPPSKNLGKEKLDAGGGVSSLKQSSKVVMEKEKLPYCSEAEVAKLGSQTGIPHEKCSPLEPTRSKSANLKSKGKLAEDGCLQMQKIERNPALHGNWRGKAPRTKAKSMPLTNIISGKSKATCSEVVPVDAFESHDPATCLVTSDSGAIKEKSGKECLVTSDSGAIKEKSGKECLVTSDSGAIKEKSGNECLVTSDSGAVKEKGGKEIIPSGSGPKNIDAIERSRQVDCILQAAKNNTHKDSDCPNGKKNIESQQGGYPGKAATAKRIHVSSSDPASDERSHLRELVQLKAASKGSVIPMANSSWMGKFQIHKPEGIVMTLDGIQAHLPSCASLDVAEAMDRLPKIIALEELPRMRIWPSQFMGNQLSEENIALYFFANGSDSYKYYANLMDHMITYDLALKGNLNGIELFIFPSKVLPEKSQLWNRMFFFWGIFRGQKENNLANELVSKSPKVQQGDGDAVIRRGIDLNGLPENDDEVEGDDVEIPKSNGSPSLGPSGDKILLHGDNIAKVDLKIPDSNGNHSLVPSGGRPLLVRDDNARVGVKITELNDNGDSEPSRDRILLAGHSRVRQNDQTSKEYSKTSGHRNLQLGDNSNVKEKEANTDREEIDVNLSLWPESEPPENNSVRIENNNVEQPSTSLSLALSSTAFRQEYLLLTQKHVMDAFFRFFRR